MISAVVVFRNGQGDPSVMTEIIILMAKTEWVSEREIYQRHLRDNPRHYQRLTG